MTSPAPSEKPSEEAMRIAARFVRHNFMCPRAFGPSGECLCSIDENLADAIDSAMARAVRDEQDRIRAFIERQLDDALHHEVRAALAVMHNVVRIDP